MQMTKEETTTTLNEVLRGELSAIETYCQAIENIREPNIIAILEEAHNCHVMRANLLSDKVRELGAEAAVSSGVWGALAKLIESGAQIFGDRATIAILEEGEDHGLEQYTALCSDTNPEIRNLGREFLPKQEGTHSIMKDLKLSLS
jgi:demethoxyubiquinone hydroxylase (CLK1/Coq7/Cat5 family)